MIDLIDFKQKRLNDVVSNQFKPGVPKMVHHVLLPPREEVVHNDHAIASANQTIHQMTANESGAAGDDDPEALPLQSEGDFAHRVDPEPGGQVAVLVHGSVSRLEATQLGWDVRIGDRRVGTGGGWREDGEEERGDGNADEDEDEALLAEEVIDRASHAEPRLRPLRRVRVAHWLRLVASEYQLGSHVFFVRGSDRLRSNTVWLDFVWALLCVDGEMESEEEDEVIRRAGALVSGVDDVFEQWEAGLKRLIRFIEITQISLRLM